MNIAERLWPFRRPKNHFTLQWHLTQRCSFSCRHCYDRSSRGEPSLDQSIDIVHQLRAFCAHRRLRPHISLSGGDPLLYTHFWDLYHDIARHRISVSLLGNPTATDVIERLIVIQRPVSYQVSLEGLQEHNDRMRGHGHFERTLTFLREARRRGLNTHVMLTLTNANIDQVIPLGHKLRGLTSRMTFNRLSQTGQGADLDLPRQDDYVAFLKQYLQARRSNPIFGFKDNLFNILRHTSGQSMFPGCTGHGCGAALDFLALLPDGEVHACRKFPSLIGRLQTSSLAELYDAPQAILYRHGATACQACLLRKHCGGCMAVTSGAGLDPLVDRDPHCFAADNFAHSSARTSPNAITTSGRTCRVTSSPWV